MSREQQKQDAAAKAVEYIPDNSIVGLGSGSTMYWVMQQLGELVQQGMHVQGIPSSPTTEQWAKEFHVPLVYFSTEITKADVAIDGADEVAPGFHMTKGGGGSLLREKIIADAADKVIIAVDESKIVQQLGSFPLPVEVTPFGWQKTVRDIQSLGCDPVLRRSHGAPFETDNANYVIDCDFQLIERPDELHNQLIQLVGVVETGLFADQVDIVIAGTDSGAEMFENKR
ncbi:ribose 5-phosphate isomerase A [Marinococcus halophilus]|uniref:Ribose-5-phosphate isomerase A n=1 Tax=Marinococcus halophilus TaxID=1371 RepID=A0A510Y743_MARHA|nr:ribose-5-phosphate isomerase RpiA [Marinococcus halophilus]OZT80624.1 ribose 5-phosphate isomerase A [Marinococcus halophilus]GEK58983.1 ribose-5-phosphate isomerase A [Marinococcus halophilus]